ncbi:MAG: LysE family transporter [Sneathiella sp.]
MTVHLVEGGLFVLTAIVLLGTPGPAIAALVAIGRQIGFKRSLRFFIGLQCGLAFAAAISAAGLFSALQALPGATLLMTITASTYLAYLAYKIATAPVGIELGTGTERAAFTPTPAGGFLLGASNPKAYVAFISMMASYQIVPSHGYIDASAKWFICILVMIFVDTLWLWFGDIIRRSNLSAKAERILNVCMAAIILATIAFALFDFSGTP